MTAVGRFSRAFSGVSDRPNVLLLSCCAIKWSSAAYPRRAASTTREWSTPLARTIAEAIRTTGPITIAQYMRQCLTSPEGYYSARTRSKDPFGRTGDFVTSPEISQVFGELVGIWLVSQWIAQGRKSQGIDIIEVGPGRGTLMDDVLRTLQNFNGFFDLVQGIHLMEASDELRKQQKDVLCGDGATVEQTPSGWKGSAKYKHIPVNWYEDMRFMPRESARMPFIIAHEFFDALPIQAFQSIGPSAESKKTIEGLHGPIKLSQTSTSTSKTPQWRELMVKITQPSANLTIPSRPALNTKAESRPDFELMLAKASTPSSLVLPEISGRYKALKARPGSIIEISSETHRHAVDFAERVGGPTSSAASAHNSRSITGSIPTKTSTAAGAALVIDYGTSDTVPTSTLRGIKSHKLVSPFSHPGEVDLSADVDFTALAEAAIDASEGVEVHGPIEQGEWLQRMGIKERAETLCAQVTNDIAGAETAKKIQDSVKRLVERGGGGMGKLYKVIAIVPESGGRRPVGFGGEIET